MSFADSIKTCFSKYFDGKGRASRSEYWWFWLLYFIVDVVLQYTGSTVLSWLILAMVIPVLTAGIRRMHDVDKSGWFLLIPIYNLVLLATDGTPGPNRFGGPAVDLSNLAPPTSY